MKEGKYLPVGTVCKIKDVDKLVFIVGFCVKGSGSDKAIHDYVGCFYPRGEDASKKHILFDHNQIMEVLYIGFQSEEDKAYKLKIAEVINGKSTKIETPDIEVLDMNKPVAQFVYVKK